MTEVIEAKPVNLDEIELVPARFRDDVTVELVDSMGTEENIVRAARVSTKGADSRGTEANSGLVRYLYREGHGTPFESVILQWYFETPIFVDRQIMTHRIASTNGESGRYKQLEGVFYVVGEERPLIQIGKVGAYEFQYGRPDHVEAVKFVQRSTAESTWENYQKLKAYGIANEVARQHLPTTLYVSRYWTANLRSTLNFISLRKDWGEEAAHQSKAMYEIALMADKMAEVVKEKFPTVWEQFVAKGYTSV
jgi:thymidylate synthase (FAD)